MLLVARGDAMLGRAAALDLDAGGMAPLAQPGRRLFSYCYY